MQPSTISRPGVRLRPLQGADTDVIYHACQDPLVQAFTAVLPVPYLRKDAVQFVEEITPSGWADGTSCTWAIEDPLREGLIGVMGLDHISSDTASVGYWLAPNGRGRGLATRALSEVCRFGFDTLGLAAIRWEAFEGNEASRRVAERIGFQVSGPVRLLSRQRGQLRDAWIATLLPGDEPPPKPPVLSDGVVTLRSWRGSDRARLADLVDEEVLRWTGFPGASREEMDEWLDGQRRYCPAPQGRFAVSTASGDVIGHVRIGSEPGSGAATLGWWLGPQARGQGLAARAVRLAMTWAAGEGVRRFAAGIFAGNASSIALAERLGMQNEGLRRAYWPSKTAGGEPRDTWLYSLVPGDLGWPASPGKPDQIGEPARPAKPGSTTSTDG